MGEDRRKNGRLGRWLLTAAAVLAVAAAAILVAVPLALLYAPLPAIDFDASPYISGTASELVSSKRITAKLNVRRGDGAGLRIGAAGRLLDWPFTAKADVKFGFVRADVDFSLSLDETEWRLSGAFAVRSARRWRFSVNVPEAKFSSEDDVVGHVLSNLRHSSVSNLTCSGAFSLSAHGERTPKLPVASWSARAEVFPGATSNELAHIQACQDAIDDGRDALAMRHARELMDSTNAEVRLQAVEAFGWIGKYAVKELAELMVDSDEHVRSEALRHWEMAFDEISSEALKVQEIERAADLLKDQSSLEAVMMKLAGLEDYNAVRTLCGIITSTNAAPVATEVAREEYASLTGEPFLDAKRAEQVAAILKNQSEGIPPEPTKEQISTKNQVGPRVPRDQGKEQK